MKPIKPAAVRYIKLGEGGRWETPSLERGELHLGYSQVPHEMALRGNRAAVQKLRTGQGRDPRAAADDAREVVDFYGLGKDCLWVTFARGHLWWTFADPEVIWLGKSTEEHGARMRRSISGWRNHDVTGRELRVDALSSRLTRTAAYRRTLCAIEDEAYLLRRINGIEEPILARANAARAELVDVTAEGIASLHWADFETLVDIVFARSGWHRVSELGKTKKDIDLELEHPVTGERAWVQVKSRASQKVLDDYIGRFEDAGLWSRLFFVCHSPKGRMTVVDRDRVHLWTGNEFARTVVKLGLHDWVFEKAA